MFAKPPTCKTKKGLLMDLTQYADENKRAPKKWADCLPGDVVTQVVEATVSTSTIVDWLISEGYAGATQKKVSDMRKAGERNGQQIT
jgi:hypothetical protein